MTGSSGSRVWARPRVASVTRVRKPKVDDEIVSAIAGVRLFESLPKATVRELAALAKVIEHDAGAEIVTAGSSGHALYAVLAGEAEVVVGRRVVNRLHEGDTFGELSLIDGQPRSATVRATEPTRTLVLSRWSARPVIEEPAVMKKLLVSLTQWLRDTNAAPVE